MCFAGMSCTLHPLQSSEYVNIAKMHARLLPLVSLYNKVTFAHSWQLNLMNVTNQDESIAHLRKSACVLCVIATVCHCQSDPAPAGPQTLFLQRARGAEWKREYARGHFHKRSTPLRATVIILQSRRYWAVTLNLVSATIIFRESAALLC